VRPDVRERHCLGSGGVQPGHRVVSATRRLLPVRRDPRGLARRACSGRHHRCEGALRRLPTGQSLVRVRHVEV